MTAITKAPGTGTNVPFEELVVNYKVTGFANTYPSITLKL